MKASIKLVFNVRQEITISDLVRLKVDVRKFEAYFNTMPVRLKFKDIEFEFENHGRDVTAKLEGTLDIRNDVNEKVIVKVPKDLTRKVETLNAALIDGVTELLYNSLSIEEIVFFTDPLVDLVSKSQQVPVEQLVRLG